MKQPDISSDLATAFRANFPPASDFSRKGATSLAGKAKKARKRWYRAVFISDVHLGTRGCKADFLLDFLRHVEVDTVYLVGDIIDGWRLKKSWFWTQEHNDVVRKILKRASKGTEVIYIPGNHDEALRDYVDLDLAGVKVRREAVHEAADGKRYWVLHGDEFDTIVRYARWLAFLGDRTYSLLLEVNRAVNWFRRHLGYPYWSLSAFLKHRTKKAVEFISSFEEALAHEAAARGVDGVICGHIHHAEIRRIGDVVYLNDGDWVESCTALVEHADGRMEILHWAAEIAAREEQHSSVEAAA